MALPPVRPSVMAPIPSLSDRSGEDPQKLDLEALRRLRSELQAFQSFLLNVRNGQSKILTFYTYVQQTREEVTVLVEQLKDGDSISQIKNLWEQIKENPLMLSPEEEHESQQQLHYLDMLDSQIRQIVFLIGYLTIPERLNQWLSQAWSGYYIPFHLVFEDELPVAEDRQRVLNYIAWSPKTIQGGIVDPVSGLIYRYSESLNSRLLSLLWIILGLAGSIGIVIGAASINPPGWPISKADVSTLLVGWAAVLLGVILHMAVGSTKRSKSQTGLPPILAVRNLLLVIDAHMGNVLMKLLMALIGFFALLFTAGLENLTPFNTFLVGYTLDSFLELFGANLEQRAAAQAAAVKQQLQINS